METLTFIVLHQTPGRLVFPLLLQNCLGLINVDKMVNLKRYSNILSVQEISKRISITNFETSQFTSERARERKKICHQNQQIRIVIVAIIFSFELKTKL